MYNTLNKKKNVIKENLEAARKTVMYTRKEINSLRQEDAFHNRILSQTVRYEQKANIMKK